MLTLILPQINNPAASRRVSAQKASVSSVFARNRESSVYEGSNGSKPFKAKTKITKLTVALTERARANCFAESTPSEMLK